MAEAWGAIERAIGTVLSTIFDLIPSYAVAIILLTILVRIVLIPLTVKQIRSMSAMQKIQPELKRLQQKYKGDRQKMNEELMKLYKEHGVNPLGGCFPLLMQAPVFIALYSVLRAAVFFDAGLAAPVQPSIVVDKEAVCRLEGAPAAEGPVKTTVICTKGDQSESFQITLVKQQKLPNPPSLAALPSFVTTCSPRLDAAKEPDELEGFVCHSPFGTGHLPTEGDLFADLVRDKSTFLGMHLGCSPQQAASKTAIRQCTAAEDATGGGALVGYYGLVAMMIGSTWYQQRQMVKQATGPQAKQMQMMGRIMPIFLGFISLSIPAGVIIYWIVSNVWTIGQQQFFLKRQQAAPETSPPAPAGGKGKSGKPRPNGPKPKPNGPKPRR